MKYAWIREHTDAFPVAVMCRVLQVSASGYYAWLHRKPSERQHRRDALKEAVSQTLEEVHEPYLIQLGFLKRTQQGRVATPLAYKHFGLNPPEHAQPTLF